MRTYNITIKEEESSISSVQTKKRLLYMHVYLDPRSGSTASFTLAICRMLYGHFCDRVSRERVRDDTGRMCIPPHKYKRVCVCGIPILGEKRGAKGLFPGGMVIFLALLLVLFSLKAGLHIIPTEESIQPHTGKRAS